MGVIEDQDVKWRSLEDVGGGARRGSFKVSVDDPDSRPTQLSLKVETLKAVPASCRVDWSTDSGAGEATVFYRTTSDECTVNANITVTDEVGLAQSQQFRLEIRAVIEEQLP